MIRILFFLISGVILLGDGDKLEGQKVATFNIQDSNEIQILLRFDSLGMPENYMARIFTPVCESERCYAIELDLYWNLIGGFIGYDTLQGKELTKLDHIPFTKHDYQKLQEILLNESSALDNFEKEDLIQNTRGSQLDGITGATAAEIKNSVINGAVYSCYSLWHIAHGPAVDSIQKSTMKMLSKNFVKKLVDQQNVEINYFLIDHFSAEDFNRYLPEILQTLEFDQGYYVKNAIEKMPSEIFLNPDAQAFFVENFEKMSYFSQVTLLKKLLDIKIADNFAKVLKASLTERSSYRNELISEVLRNN